MRGRSLGRLGTLVAVGLLGIGAAGCAGAGQGSSPAQRMTAWAEGTGFGGVVATLQADSSRIATVLGEHRGTGAVRADCVILLDDTEAANQNLPTPDAGLTSLLSHAYTLEGQAANDCYAAGAATGTRQETSSRLRAVAGGLLDQALAEIRTLTGKTPPTTTTAAPGGVGIFG